MSSIKLIREDLLTEYSSMPKDVLKEMMGIPITLSEIPKIRAFPGSTSTMKGHLTDWYCISKRALILACKEAKRKKALLWLRSKDAENFGAYILVRPGNCEYLP